MAPVMVRMENQVAFQLGMQNLQLDLLQHLQHFFLIHIKNTKFSQMKRVNSDG